MERGSSRRSRAGALRRSEHSFGQETLALRVERKQPPRLDNRGSVKIGISHRDLVEPLVQALNETECCAARTGAQAVDVFVPWLAFDGDPRQARIEVLFFVRSWGLPHAEFEAELMGAR
jgi:hypothetical protein